MIDSLQDALYSNEKNKNATNLLFAVYGSAVSIDSQNYLLWKLMIYM